MRLYYIINKEESVEEALRYPPVRSVKDAIGRLKRYSKGHEILVVDTRRLGEEDDGGVNACAGGCDVPEVQVETTMPLGIC